VPVIHIATVEHVGASVPPRQIRECGKSMSFADIASFHRVLHELRLSHLIAVNQHMLHIELLGQLHGIAPLPPWRRLRDSRGRDHPTTEDVSGGCEKQRTVDAPGKSNEDATHSAQYVFQVSMFRCQGIVTAVKVIGHASNTSSFVDRAP
jgi:hypothetical protein